MHIVASCWILSIQSHDARNHEYKKNGNKYSGPRKSGHFSWRAEELFDGGHHCALRIIIRTNIYVKHNFLVYLLSAATCFDLRSSSGHALLQVRKCHAQTGIPFVYNMKTFVIIMLLWGTIGSWRRTLLHWVSLRISLSEPKNWSPRIDTPKWYFQWFRTKIRSGQKVSLHCL